MFWVIRAPESDTLWPIADLGHRHNGWYRNNSLSPRDLVISVPKRCHTRMKHVANRNIVLIQPSHAIIDRQYVSFSLAMLEGEN